MILDELALSNLFTDIDELIEERKIDQACTKYLEFFRIIENENNTVNESIKAKFYASFAYFLFDISEYDESLLMFSKAQKYGYSKYEIKEFIYNTFIKPNLEEYKENYNKNIEYLLSEKTILKSLKFEELSFWLIPIMKENQYYIYDKNEEEIKCKIDISLKYNGDYYLNYEDEFADFLIVSDWNINTINKYVNKIRNMNKKSYVVVSEYNKFLSLLQGVNLHGKDVSNLSIFDSFDSFDSFFRRFNMYLPRNVVELTGEVGLAKNVIRRIHQFRITKSGRKGDNVLLSICIPTYNRGHRAYETIINTLKSKYDEEIEIVISNNGTKNETVDYYKKIKEFEDARIKYYEFNENVGFTLNVCNVVDMASGKYVVTLSDEDLLYIDKIHEILNILDEGKIDILRTRGNIQGQIPSTQLCNGEKGILTYMLTSNYISGIIFKNELLKKYECTNYIKNKLDNQVCTYYPQMCWELQLCQYGSIKGEDIILFDEGEQEKTDIGTDNNETIPIYATLEGRVEQFKGYFEIFNDMEICRGNFDLLRKMYIKLVKKYMYLTYVSIDVFYRKMNKNLSHIILQMYDLAIEYLNKLYNGTGEDGTYYEDKNSIEGIYRYYEVLL